MPHLPDHVTHDPELIAAFAAGDATGSALDEATALVAECADCAALHRDLRAIATALPDLPVPARSRDFRLTPEQADALRPSGWRGLLAAFASPRFRLAAPLGTGLAAAGLAGLLLASPGGLFSAGAATSEGTVATPGAAAAQAAPAEGAGASSAPAIGEDASGAALAVPVAPPAPAASSIARSELDAATQGQTLTGPALAPASAAASAAPAAGFAGGEPTATSGAGRDLKAETASPQAPVGEGGLADASLPATTAATPLWVVASAAILLLGVALVGLRLVARRLARF